MTLYRVWWDTLPNDDELVDVVEADCLESAIVIFGKANFPCFENGDGLDGFGGEEYTAQILSQCICSDNSLVFINKKYPEYPGEWECQNCGKVFCAPPDQFSHFQWEVEEMFAAGYLPCPVCDSYNERCRFCQGAGWYKPGEEEPARAWNGINCPDCGRHLDVYDGGQQYNYEANVPACNSCGVVYWEEWEPEE